MPAKLDDIDTKLKLAIAIRLKELRSSQGKKQKDFAYDLGRDKQSVNKNEQGKGATIYTINKFCKEIGISLSDFFNDPLFK
jgi:transcriptional regulator with XRE-family HTH domain